MINLDAWAEDMSEVLAFARQLENNCVFSTRLDVIYFFAKPWKWTTEYHIWKEQGDKALEKYLDEKR